LRFPYKIDVPEPLGGFDVQLDAMREWCRRTVGSDAWAYHPHQDPKIRSAEGVPVPFCPFLLREGKGRRRLPANVDSTVAAMAATRPAAAVNRSATPDTPIDGKKPPVASAAGKRVS